MGDDGVSVFDRRRLFGLLLRDWARFALRLMIPWSDSRRPVDWTGGRTDPIRSRRMRFDWFSASGARWDVDWVSGRMEAGSYGRLPQQVSLPRGVGLGVPFPRQVSRLMGAGSDVLFPHLA